MMPGDDWETFVIGRKLSAFRETEGAEVNKFKTAWHVFKLGGLDVETNRDRDRERP